MIQLYIAKIKTGEDETVAVFHNCLGVDMDEQIKLIREKVKQNYGDQVTLTMEPDKNNEYTKTHYPDQYDQMIAMAMGHLAKFN